MAGGAPGRVWSRPWSPHATDGAALARIDGSINIPLNHLVERMDDVPADRPVLVHCAGGYRSSIAASLLQKHGRVRLTEHAGGLAA